VNIYGELKYISFVTKTALDGPGLSCCSGSEIALNYKSHISLYSPGREIGPSQKSLTEKHDIHKRQFSMPSTGFYSAITTTERSQTYAFDLMATGIGGLEIQLHEFLTSALEIYECANFMILPLLGTDF
jgi:hypothetical protein